MLPVLLLLGVVLVVAGVLYEPEKPAAAAPTAPPRPAAAPSATDSLGLTFVALPAGTFVMGHDGTHKPARPAHLVHLSRPFEMGRHEVTQRQWQAVMGTTPWRGVPFAQSGADHPAIQITWLEVQTFLERLNARDPAYRYRLPTEAEWEYAARADTTLPYAGTATPADLCTYANLADATARARYPTWKALDCDDGYALTAPVGTYQPNAWGLYDMTGNVWEFVSDWMGTYPEGPTTDPLGPDTGTHRVVRGNSFDGYENVAVLWHRFFVLPGERYSFVGFRLVREPRRSTP